MPDLEMLLRDVRPEPDPVWAEKLDAKVAARFPGPVPAWKQKLHTLRDHFAALTLVTASTAALMLVLVVVVKNVNTGGGDENTSASSGSSSAIPEVTSGSGSSVDSAASPKKSKPTTGASGSAALPPPAAGGSAGGRAVLSNAALTHTTRPDEVEDTTDRAIRITDTLGGFVQSSTTSMRGSTASAELTLKLPSDKLDAGIAQLSKLGHVSSRSQQAEDVTDQRDQLEAAVRDARADRDGLRSRLAKATTDKQRDRLRAQLNRASRRVTSAERRVAELNNTVSYATVDLTVRGRRSSEETAVPGDRWTPGDALGDAGRVLEVIAGVLVIGLAILLPIAILIALAGFANRGLTRRRRERALEAS
jgi:hypothetical protein